MASSSAIQLADVALTWSNVKGNADLSLIDSDIASDRGLMTAFALSLFTDARANDDDVPPSGDPRDRRGWWADQFAATVGDRFGSRLWLLDRSKRTNDTILHATQYATESLAWAIDDKVCESIDVTVTASTNGLVIAVAAKRPGRDAVTFRFARVWDNLQRDM
ncbi:MAG: phage GP46 family protein [Betaproteobacteria bacterium]